MDSIFVRHNWVLNDNQGNHSQYPAIQVESVLNGVFSHFIVEAISCGTILRLSIRHHHPRKRYYAFPATGHPARYLDHRQSVSQRFDNAGYGSHRIVDRPERPRGGFGNL